MDVRLRWAVLAAGFSAFLVVAATSCGGKAECSPASCGGCCDADGECQVGSLQEACGMSGATCAVCTAGQVCLTGFCSTPSGGKTDGGVKPGQDGGTSDGGTSDGGTVDIVRPCTAAVDCAAGEICHPEARVCVTTCQSSWDCPSHSAVCDPLSPVSPTNVCKCATDALCSAGGAAAVCSTDLGVCMGRCAGATDCPSGLTCEATTGQCRRIPCNWESCSTANWEPTSQGRTCGPSGCAVGDPCSGFGMSSCAPNEACSGGACGLPPRPQPGSCSNFYSGAYASGPQWNPAADEGPVIYEVAKVSSGMGTGSGSPIEEFGQCQTTQTQFNVRVRAYRLDASWPATKSEWAASGPALHYVNVGGTLRDVQASPTMLRPNIGYTPSDQNLELELYFCVTGTVTSFQPGFFFGVPPGSVGARGNEACRQL